MLVLANKTVFEMEGREKGSNSHFSVTHGRTECHPTAEFMPSWNPGSAVEMNIPLFFFSASLLVGHHFSSLSQKKRGPGEVLELGNKDIFGVFPAQD